MMLFSVKNALSFGARTMKQHFFMLVGAMTFMLLIRFAFGWVIGRMEAGVPYALEVLLIVLAHGIDMVLMMGMVRISLTIYDGQAATVGQLFSEYQHLFAYVVSSFLYLLAVTVGLVVFIVPGLIVAARAQFFTQIIIDHHTGPLRALRQSFEMTRGFVWPLIMLGVVNVAANVVGSLLFELGLILSIPFSLLTMVYAYRTLAMRDAVAAKPIPKMAEAL